MANTLLTPTAVTREALRILHQKLTFVGAINRQYDDSFAKTGAKIGDSLKIRLPNQYTVRTGKTLNAQDTTESSVTLQVATQKGVDMNFSTADMTLSLDDFSKRILEPAMAVLAANIEADAISMYKDIYQEVSDVGATTSLAAVLNASKRLSLALAPSDGRCLLLSEKSNVDLVSANSTLYNDRAKISEQYRKGFIGNEFFGFDDAYKSTHLPIHTTGTEAGADTGANVNGANQTGASVTVNGTVTGTFKKGDIISFAGCYDVHPETKSAYSHLKQFVVTSDVDTGYSSIPISPSIVTSGATQNCSASPTNTGEVWKVESDDTTAIAGSADYQIDLAFHKDAFAFATADLIMPKGVDFAAREVYDGISIRIVRQYDINNDNMPCRLDVLYGYKTIRPELACRIGFN
ncbi:MAG: hypothetical protein H7829_17110 [Magnetococcus sp. THC-1_WYH]